MVNIYDRFKDDGGSRIPGRTKLFIMSTSEDGGIDRYISGVAFTSEENGTQFIVDDWLVDQIEKLQFIDGTLSVREGETLKEPVKSEKELQREALLKQLAELETQPSE